MAILFIFVLFVFLYLPLKAYRRAVQALHHHHEYTLLPDMSDSDTRGGERIREKEKEVAEAKRRLKRGLWISAAALAAAVLLAFIMGWEAYLRIMFFHSGRKLPQFHS